MNIIWSFDQSKISWNHLADLYRVAPLGKPEPKDLEVIFSNSKFKCFVYNDDMLVGAGRALADGLDCSYVCHVAVHPDYQGIGLGKQIIEKLVAFSKGHKKIILYANPGKEGFYARLGFKKMNTAMAIFENEKEVFKNGTLSDT